MNGTTEAEARQYCEEAKTSAAAKACETILGADFVTTDVEQCVADVGVTNLQ